MRLVGLNGSFAISSAMSRSLASLAAMLASASACWSVSGVNGLPCCSGGVRELDDEPREKNGSRALNEVVGVVAAVVPFGGLLGAAPLSIDRIEGDTLRGLLSVELIDVDELASTVGGSR